MEPRLLPGYDYPEEMSDLLNEYTQMLVEGDPDFQDYLVLQKYDDELVHLDVKYGPPDGRLYIAFYGDEPAGCVAMRKLDDQNCEMKRLYVRPAFRKRGLAHTLVTQILQDAKDLGYRHLLLDTLPFLTVAIDMYKRLGFYEIESYNNNPMENLLYLQYDL